MLVELLALTTARVSLRRDTVPEDVSHKTPFRLQTLLQRGRRTAKQNKTTTKNPEDKTNKQTKNRR